MEPEPVYAHPDDLLVTKLFIPQMRDGLVARPRLVDQLSASRGKKLVLVHAPAGYGKTTLLTEWCDSQGESLAWYSLDDSDNDLGRLPHYPLPISSYTNTRGCLVALP